MNVKKCLVLFLAICLSFSVLSLVVAAEDTTATKDTFLLGFTLGEFISLASASKIWELYGVPGLGTDEMPPENTPIGGMAAYHVKTGKHSITAYDWEQYYNQADNIW